MPWIVYDSDRSITGVFRTQAQANTHAAKDTSWTAHDSETTGADWDENAQPGWYFSSAGAVSRYPAKTTGAIAGLHDAIHATLTSWGAIGRALDSSALGRNPDVDLRARQYFWRALQGLYTLMNDTSISVANRTTIAEAYAAGPADAQGTRGSDTVADPLAWWAIVEAASDPIGMISIVSTTTRAAVNLADAETISGREPAAALDIVGGAWVASITS